MPTGPSPGGTSSQRDAQDSREIERELTVVLARSVVSREAADELPIFQATSDAYFETPDSVLRRVVRKDDTLGFGADTLAAMAPFALAASSAVVNFLAQQALAAAAEAGRGAVVEVLRGWLARLRSPDVEASPESPALTSEQLSRVREIAYEKGRQLKLSEDESDLLADAMVGSLAATG